MPPERTALRIRRVRRAGAARRFLLTKHKQEGVIMIQKAEKNAEIEKVCQVFADYIKTSPYIEWLWSEKMGYVLLQIGADRSEIVESQVISDAGRLCRILFGEVAGDVLKAAAKEHDIYEADPSEQAEIEKRLQPYADQLPQYRHYCKTLFDK